MSRTPGTDDGAPDELHRYVFTNRFAVLDDSRYIMPALIAVVVLLGVGVTQVPDIVPISLVFPFLVVSGLLLEPRRLTVVLAVVAVVVAVWVPHSLLAPLRVVGVLVAVVAVMGLVVVISRSRARVGTRGLSGDRMFAELRDRISSGGRVPALPAGWSATSCILSAHGDRFSGDFVIAHLHPSGTRLEVALVDVSGKGTGAGTRSLLLSGALGGLLGAVPSEDFLRAANEYLLRQGWEEGFATAVHLDVDLCTGSYSTASAGHPAPARYTSGRARWTVLDAGRGPILGIVPDVEFPRQQGSLGRGDALLVYSDGVIEARDRDLTDGIDRMLGVAAMSVLREGDVARDVCESARSGEDDDRAALAVRRV
ncbi:PP2C family protein-serine/threonine phosphatase [Phycicoccus flavus]|uniref:Serine/threonine-protein phosphatase n=1 Tax=Phycicoccus flavus TaxID=2502783 RepID=A0A8T6R1P8_9MICO|nr:PP2C family protein-serine/threonine phosphatase [Phycicoccus flavus]NHA67553.1 serine/threonine-protein phosphatase [Phycicoccus flavus]